MGEICPLVLGARRRRLSSQGRRAFPRRNCGPPSNGQLKSRMVAIVRFVIYPLANVLAQRGEDSAVSPVTTGANKRFAKRLGESRFLLCR